MMNADKAKFGLSSRTSQAIGNSDPIFACKSSIGLRRLQRTSSNMNSRSWRSISSLRQKRNLAMLFLLCMVCFPYRAIVSQQENSWSQGQNQQDQGSTDNTAPQSESSAGTQSDQGLDAQSMQDRPAQTKPTEPEQATDSQTMSADQIISILKQEPMILASIKEQIYALRHGLKSMCEGLTWSS